jgi:hypothetical protein
MGWNMDMKHLKSLNEYSSAKLKTVIGSKLDNCDLFKRCSSEEFSAIFSEFRHPGIRRPGLWNNPKNYSSKIFNPFSKSEINEIKGICDRRWSKYDIIHGHSSSYYKYGTDSISIIISGMIYNSNQMWFDIYKDFNDYFFVRVKMDYSFLNLRQEDRKWKCDQIDGLIEFLSEFLTEQDRKFY